MIILDTNVISELRKIGSGRVSPQVVTWFEQTELADTYISCITLAELQTGILSLRFQRDYQQADIIENWLKNWVLPHYQNRILDINADIALIYSAFHVPNKKSVHDGLIGATAIYHHCPVATRNVSDFEGMAVELINPFE